jgi:ribosomal RNA-processing protein 12
MSTVSSTLATPGLTHGSAQRRVGELTAPCRILQAWSCDRAGQKLVTRPQRFSSMVSRKRPSGDTVGNVGNVASLGGALPSAYRGPSRKRRDALKTAGTATSHGTSVIPAELPPCFAEVWRRRSSTLPVHRNERAALEAVAASIPNEAADYEPSAAAGLYLAALVVALRRVLQTSKPVANPEEDHLQEIEDLGMSKRQRQKARKRIEKDVIATVDGLHASVKGAPLSGSLQDAPVDGSKQEEANVEISTDDIGLISSLVYLISLSLRDANSALVNAKCEDVLEAVTMAVVHAGGVSAVSRHVAAAVAGTLALLETSAWGKPSVQRAFQRLVSLSADADPKTRHRGREALQALLRGPKGSFIAARTSSFSAAHTVGALRELQSQIAEESGTLGRRGVHRASTKLIHRISAVNFLATTFLPTDAATVAKELLSIAASELPFVTLFAFDALTTLCSDAEMVAHLGQNESGAPDENVDDHESGRRPTAIPTAQLGKMLIVLAELPISNTGHDDTVTAYSTCVSRVALSYFHAHKFSPPPVASMLLPVRAIVERMDPAVVSHGVSSKVAGGLLTIIGQKWMKAKPEIFAVLESLLEYRFKAVWSEVLGPLRRYLEQDGSSGKPSMRSVLTAFTAQILKSRSDALERNDRKTAGMLTSILCSVLRGGGVEIILDSVRLERDDKLLLSNAWLLPVLHEHVRFSPMALFISKLQPLALGLRGLAEEAEDGGRAVESKNANMLSAQIWDLLPCFCNSPSDLSQDAVLSDMFNIFEAGLKSAETSVRRQSVIGALRSLATSVSGLSSDDPAADGLRKIFCKGLKRIFPLISSLVEETPSERRGPILEAVTYGARACSDAKIITGFLRKSIRRMLEASVAASGGPQEGDDVSADVAPMTDVTAGNIRHAATDLATAIAESGAVPSDAAEIDFFERAMSPLFMDASDTILQKKAYRAAALLVSLGVVGKDDSTAIKFVENTAAASSSVAASSKSTRLVLIQSLVELCKTRTEPKTLLEVCTSNFLPEIVMCSRDVSEKTRAAAFAALSAFGRAWYTIGGQRGEGLCQYIQLLAAGLAGRTVSMLSSTMTSLSHVIFEFRGEARLYSELSATVDALYGSKALGLTPLDGEIGSAKRTTADENDTVDSMEIVDSEGVLAGPVSILLRHSAHEVQKAALGMVKTATSALSTPPARLEAILPAIIPGLVAIAAKSKKKETRLRVRIILERLLRKCGRDSLESVFPPEHAKLLSAVRKQYSRDLTKKHESREKRRLEKQQMHSITDGVANGEDTSDDDDSDNVSDFDSDLEKEVLDGDALSVKQRLPTSKGKAHGLVVREDRDKVVDLLETRVMDGFMTSDEVAEQSKRALAEQRKSRRGGSKAKNSFVIADDGRPIFAESDGDDGDLGAKFVDRDGDDEKVNAGFRSVGGLKRKRGAREVNDRAKKIKGSFGEEYRSRKGASGDMKRPGKPDPYAYIPLGSAVGSEVTKAIVGSGAGGKGPLRRKTKRHQSSIGKLGGRRGLPATR